MRSQIARIRCARVRGIRSTISHGRAVCADMRAEQKLMRRFPPQYTPSMNVRAKCEQKIDTHAPFIFFRRRETKLIK